jgi:hypothetical protein
VLPFPARAAEPSPDHTATGKELASKMTRKPLPPGQFIPIVRNMIQRKQRPLAVGNFVSFDFLSAFSGPDFIDPDWQAKQATQFAGIASAERAVPIRVGFHIEATFRSGLKPNRGAAARIASLT